MWRVAPNAKPYLRVRSRPNGDILGGFLPGKELNVLGIENNWARLQTADNLTAWVSAQYIVRDVEPTPVAYRKIGIHLHIGNNIEACLQLYSDCFQAGKPLPIAVVINNVGLANAIKRVSPPTFVVFRGGITGDALDVLDLTQNNTDANIVAGRKRFEQRYTPCNADAWQIANEHYDKGHEPWKVKAMAEFYVGAMFAAEAKDVKITVGDFSTGTPEDEDLPLLAPMLQKANDDGHYLNYHSYAAPGVFDMTYAAEWFALRFERIIRGYPKLMVVLGEAGGFGQNGPDPMSLFRQLQAMLATNANVIGAALFTGNAAPPWSTNGCNVDPYLTEIGIWHRSL